jgi:hypothetical protein
MKRLSGSLRAWAIVSIAVGAAGVLLAQTSVGQTVGRRATRLDPFAPRLTTTTIGINTPTTVPSLPGTATNMGNVIGSNVTVFDGTFNPGVMTEPTRPPVRDPIRPPTRSPFRP